MSEFVNTVDTVGDEALTSSIIDRSITEFACNLTTSLGECAFFGCTALTKFVCKNDASIFIDSQAFRETGIKLIDLWGRATFMPDYIVTTTPYMFYNTPLTALILRSTKLCKIGSRVTNLFHDSPISSGTGYIYVPSALVDSYKADSKWSQYADQFRALEDYTVDGTVTGELDSSKI